MTMHAGTPEVKEIMMDFEMAAWRAAAHMMPEVECKGCAFHWGQAVWRKAQDIGLRQGYLEDNSTYTYVRKLMALSLLPGEHVTPIFRVLEGKTHTPQLQLLGTVLSQYVVAVGFLIEKKLLLDKLPIMVTIVILIQ